MDLIDCSYAICREGCKRTGGEREKKKYVVSGEVISQLSGGGLCCSAPSSFSLSRSMKRRNLVQTILPAWNVVLRGKWKALWAKPQSSNQSRGPHSLLVAGLDLKSGGVPECGIRTSFPLYLYHRSSTTAVNDRNSQKRTTVRDSLPWRSSCHIKCRTILDHQLRAKF